MSRLQFSIFKLLQISGCLLVLNAPQAASAADVDEREPQDPTYSRDGKQIAYVQGVTKAGEVLPSTREIWIINRDGTGARRLTSGKEDAKPHFSPDGQRISFARDRDIWLINADGSGLQNLTKSEASEEGGEFTNDGRSLVFLRKASKTLTDAEKAALAADPWMALGLTGVQSVVMKDLQTGAERELLGDGYSVEQVAPVPFDDNVVFILCKPVGNDGKPIGELSFDKTVAVLRLDGSLPREVYKPKAGSKLSLKSMRIRPTRNLFEVNQSDKFGAAGAILKDDELVLLPEKIIFGDANVDGSMVVGTGAATIGGRITMALMECDVETGKINQLGKPSIEEKAVEKPVVVLPSVPPVAPVVQAPNNTEAKKLLESGIDFYDDEKYPEAIASFSKAIQLDPKYAEAYYHRGQAHFYAEEKALALKDLAEAIRLKPNYSDAYVARAQVHEDSDETGDAIADYDAAIKADPKNYLAFEYRAALYVLRDEYDQALADYSEAIRLSPDNLSAYMARGKVLIDLKDNPAALENYSAAILKYPTFANGYAMRAKVYRAMGKVALALVDEGKAKELKAKAKP